MATIVPHLLPEDAAPRPRRWTVDEYLALGEAGYLGSEGQRFELIDGQIVEKMGQNQPHIAALRLVAAALRLAFGAGHDVSQQVPLHLGAHDAPEPDVTVLRGTPRDFDGRDPRPEEVALVVEVADSRLDTARGAKVALYARHGIAEYWVVNLRERTLEVRRGPRADEAWSETRILGEAERVAPLGAPGAEVLVADLLPRA